MQYAIQLSSSLTSVGQGGSGGGATTPPPFLAFTDIVTAQNNGNTDTTYSGTGNGAYVTVWGWNLGSTQGGSQLSLGGVPVTVISWGNANTPSNLYSKLGMQKIEFQVPSGVPTGAQSLVANIAGVASNSYPMTVINTGHIYYVGTGGSDSNAGTFAAPFASIQHAAGIMSNGDICYALNGYTWSTPVTLNNSVCVMNQVTAQLQTPGAPLSFIAYPSAVVTCSTMGFDTEGGGGAHAPYGNYNFCKFVFNMTGTGANTLFLCGNSRFVGNYVTAPNQTTCPDGGPVETGGSFVGGFYVYHLGNEFASMYSSSASQTQICKLSNAVYVSAARITPAGGVTESYREVAYNYIHDIYGGRGIEVYNENDGGVNYLSNVIVHHNWLENVRGEAIVFDTNSTETNYLVGNNFIFCNVEVNCGMGPNPYQSGTDVAVMTAVLCQLTASTIQSNVYIWNNTLYGYSSPGATFTGGMYLTQNTLANIHPQNNVVYCTNGITYVVGTLTTANYGNVWFNDGTAPAWDTGAIASDPLFLNGALDNFNLHASSPARTSGAALPSAITGLGALATIDITGFPIPAANLAMGAIQYQGT